MTKIREDQEFLVRHSYCNYVIFLKLRHRFNTPMKYQVRGLAGCSQLCNNGTATSGVSSYFLIGPESPSEGEGTCV